MRNIFTKKVETIKELKEKNLYLKKEIAKFEDLENTERRNIFCSKNTYGILYYRRLPLSYINTVFYTHANLLYPYVNCTFEDFLIKNAISNLDHKQQKSIVLSFAMLCVGVSATKNGPVLFLQEPFKTLQTKPLQKTSINLAQSWINKILVVDLLIKPSALIDLEFEVQRVKVLNLTRIGTIKDGKEYPFIWGNSMVQITDNFKYQVFNSDKRILEDYKDVTGKEACMNTLRNIENTYLKKCLIPPYRENENTLWLRLEYEKLGIFFHKNRLEIIYQPQEGISRLFNPDGSMTQLAETSDAFNRDVDRILYKTNVLSEAENLKKVKREECMINHYIYANLKIASQE